MTSLNLRDTAPDPEEPAAPPEEPLGLGVIRAWLAKPRPRLYRLWLWVPHTAKAIRRAAAWLRANSGPALRKTAEHARKAAVIAEACSSLAKRFADWSRTTFPPGSPIGKVAAQLARASRLFGHAALALLGINRELDRLPSLLDRDDDPPERPGESDPPPAETPSRRKPPPRAIPEEDDDSSERLLPRRPATPRKSPPRRKQPASEARPPAASPSPAPAAPTGKRAEALAKLSNNLRVHILTLGKRPRKAHLRYTLWRILNERGEATAEDLGLLLDMDPTNLARRHLGPLVEEGVLKRTFPDRITHPEQAYQSTGRPPG